MDGQICPGGSQPWDLLHQPDEIEPDWWHACQGLGPSEPELRQRCGQVPTSYWGPYKWRPSQRLKHVKAQPWLTQVKDAFRVIITKNGKKIQTGTFFLTFDTPTLPERIFLGFERFDVEPYIPLPRRCFKCQHFGHRARTCRATEDVCPLCSGTGHKQEACPNKESPTCPNCKGTYSAASKECPAFITEKRALEIQAESHCTISAAREQAGHDASSEEAAKSYARVVAHSQADLINHNLALSEENARLREVIGTLRQDNASLQQRLDGYEQRLQTLEQSMVGGAHPDTPLVGVPKNTSVGSAHNTTPVGDAHRPPVSKVHMAFTDRFWRQSWSTCQHASSPNRQDWGS